MKQWLQNGKWLFWLYWNKRRDSPR